ncbi:hypothetical protein [Fimbriiglobus ruber]|uniref:Uncharacterized protein n=1 Tax=Fimbriiglobus ruber TaxID=1908690 RepID=A0A225DCX8_9BACT|nr:hypothetical protein [Fimbriiglobus ruber]OWK37494.1 hypothetical protein FRUB_06614 [Fimbriiglobus ruber]
MISRPTQLVFTALTAVAVVWSCPGTAPAVEAAPRPRPIYPRFDLTYFPRVSHQGLIGFRPVAIARSAKGPELVSATSQLFTYAFGWIKDGTLSAAEAPAFADIEQCVFNLNAYVQPESDGEHGKIGINGAAPCVIRTIRPFDWNGRLRKWFPKADWVRHAGRSYARVQLQTTPKESVPFVLFAADDRTLVCSPEPEVRALLDRLAARKPAPAPSSGWAEIDREFLAIFFDNRETPLFAGQPLSVSKPGIEELKALADSAQTAALSLSVCDRSGIRVTVIAKDDRRAKIVTYAIRRLLEMADEDLKANTDPGPFAVMAKESLTRTLIERKGCQVFWTTSAEGNVIELLLSFIRGPV